MTVLPIVGSGHVTTPPIVLQPMASPAQTPPTNESGEVGPEKPRVAKSAAATAPVVLSPSSQAANALLRLLQNLSVLLRCSVLGSEG